MTRLFHFSDDPDIETFTPRPVAVPSPRGPGRDWLNGPLVWAIDERHQALYLFPRDCPRILLWPLPTSTAEDLAAWFGDTDHEMLAFIEEAWAARLKAGRIYRYEFESADFEDLNDAGMHVSRRPAMPIRMEAITDLPGALKAAGVDLRVLPRLTPLRGVWSTSLHASGIRLRNAQDWAGT